MKRALLAALLLSLLYAGPAHALDFDFSGTFQNDDDSVLLNFSVASQSNITIFSSSWGDSETADDGYMANAGFDPILALWDSSGNLINEQDDGHTVGSTVSNGVSYTHGSWDSYFQASLSAGDYIASITQYNNFSVSNQLSDGFINDGNPDFTYDQGYGSQPKFNGVWTDDDPRTGDWSFHVLNVEQASATNPVPEPSTILLLGTGLLGLAGLGRKRLFKKS
jgi:hypothetical protein